MVLQTHTTTQAHGILDTRFALTGGPQRVLDRREDAL